MSTTRVSVRWDDVDARAVKEVSSCWYWPLLQGDSGGPLAAVDPASGRWAVVGVVSWRLAGGGGCDSHTYSVFTRYCTVLYCTVLYCTVLFCTVLTDQVSLLTRSQSLFGLDTDAAAAPPPPAPVSRSQREIFIQLILCEYFCRYESQPQLEHAVSHELIISHHIINF